VYLFVLVFEFWLVFGYLFESEFEFWLGYWLVCLLQC